MFRHRAIRRGIEQVPNACQLPLAYQASQQDERKTADVQIQETDESLVTDKPKNGILGRFYPVSFCQ